MKALVFDTETTDLIKNIGRPLKAQPHQIEFFGITVDHDLIQLGEPECPAPDHEIFSFLEDAPTLSRMFKPPFVITEETTRITGITWPMLVNEKVFRDYAREIKAFIEGHDRIVAHNAGYDVDMCNIEFGRLDMSITWPEIVCTIEATEWFYGYRLNLGRLHHHLFGMDFSDHHRAEPDTRATARCYIELVRRGHL